MQKIVRVIRVSYLSIWIDSKPKEECMNCRGFAEVGAGPGAFSDSGCLLFRDGSHIWGLPGQVCLGNVTYIRLLITPVFTKVCWQLSPYPVAQITIQIGIGKILSLAGI